MPEKPVSPPLNKPVTELRTPNFRDGFFTALVERTGDFYQLNYPIQRGTPYAKLKGADQRIIAEFASNPLYLLKEQRPGNSSQADFGSTDLFVLWIFATQQIAQSNYNAAIDYPGESVAVSRYTRQIEMKRKVYEGAPSVAYGSTLTALVSVAITAAGTGYTQATGAVGTGATCAAVCFNGAIIDWIVTNDGTAVTTGAAIVITGDGTGATATARVQPVAAILTHQEKQEYGEDNPRSHDYVKVVRVYEIMPGPLLPFTRWDLQKGPIQGTRQAVVNTGQVATETATLLTNYEARDGSSYVSWEIKEESGSAVPGFPGYPILTDDIYDDVRGAVQQTSQLIVATGSEAGTLVNIGGVATETKYIHENQFLLNKVIETWTPPGPTLNKGDYDPISNTFVSIDETLKLTSAIVQSSGIVTIMSVDYIQIVEASKPVNALTTFERVTTYTLPDAQSEGTQMTVKEENGPFQFPATLDTIWYLATGGFIGYTKAFVRRIPQTTKVFWVFSASKPTLNLDIPFPASVYSLITPGDNLGEVMMDEVTLFYTSATVDYPASDPNLTDWLADWTGTSGERPALGEAVQDGCIFRWKVSRVFLQYLVQPQPVIS